MSVGQKVLNSVESAIFGPKTMKCKNGKGRYNGTEPSPKGLGLCARNFKVGKKLLGNNKSHFWVVRETKAGVKRWVRSHRSNTPVVMKSRRSKKSKRTIVSKARMFHNKPCKNGKGSYKGTEPSPKGRGYCARNFPAGKRMLGRTKKNYWVVRVYNGIHRWHRMVPKSRR